MALGTLSNSLRIGLGRDREDVARLCSAACGGRVGDTAWAEEQEAWAGDGEKPFPHQDILAFIVWLC